MKHVREIRNITLAGFGAGLIFSLLTDDLSRPAPILNATSVGIVGGFLAGVFELIIFKPRKTKQAFLKTVLLKIVVYFILLSLLIAFFKARIFSLFEPLSFSEYIQSEEYQTFLYGGEFQTYLTYALFSIFVIIFTKQTSGYLGKGVLFNLITGKYHRPKEETKIFLLIDICSSTTIAEKIDPVEYFQLLDRFFVDVAESVRPYQGLIYRYIGDQVTIVWQQRDKMRNADCIRAFFALKHRIHRNRELYLNAYGFVPDFRGTAHVGEVVAVEIGDVKTQVVYQGITLYEVNKLEKIPGRINNGLCISEELFNTLEIPNFCKATPAGEKEIREDRMIGLYEVAES